MITISLLIMFVLGLTIGSFLNVVIYWLESSRQPPATSRQEKRQNLFGRSFCPNCKHALGFWDLIPLFNWLFLRARCRYCEEKISVQYPLVELGTGLIFSISYSYSLSVIGIRNLPTVNGQLQTIFGYGATVLLLTVNCLLLIVFTYDLKHKIIPDKIIYPAIALAAVYQIFSNQFSIFNYSFLISIVSAILAGGFFYFLAAISDGKWMGGGDIKLVFLMGLLLGFPNILVALFLGFFLGAIVGISLMVLNKAKMKSEIPFGPFLIAGTWIALFWGNMLVELYMKAFL